MPHRTGTFPFALAAVLLTLVLGCGPSGPAGALRSPGFTGTATPMPGQRERGARVRVDQVGYLPTETKVAYLMTSAASRDLRFDVRDTAGRSVLAGRPGQRRGAWNATFAAVYPLDLSSLSEPGTYRVRVTGPGVAADSPWFRVDSADRLLSPLLPEFVRFFQAQRDGENVVRSVLDRRPSHLTDRGATVYEVPRYRDGALVGRPEPVPGSRHVDVSGGWADAGDYLKFTHTASYSVIALYYAYREAPAGLTAAGRSVLLAEAAHGLEWLARMWDDRTRTLYAQVGLGQGDEHVLSDHDLWRLPQMDDELDVRPGDPLYLIKYRPVFRVAAPGEPISPNLAGRVAGAFALAAQVTAGHDAGRARRYLERGARIYAMADTTPTAGLVTVYPGDFYSESSWCDDMEFGAVELARAAEALGDGRAGGWLKEAGHWADGYLTSGDRGTLGLGDIAALAHADLIKAIDENEGADEADGPGGGLEVSRARLLADLARPLAARRVTSAADPFGAGVDQTRFDSVANAMGLVATAGLYRRAGGSEGFAALATAQRDWALGANAWGVSFVIGTGTRFPHCPSHQVADLAGDLDGTGDILRGGVVNGPNGAGRFDGQDYMRGMRPCTVRGLDVYDGRGSRFIDHVSAWQSVEPADDFAASAVLAMALS